MGKNVFTEVNAKAIWSFENKINHYCDFKKDFTLEKISNNAKLFIAVDTEYAVFINGKFVDMGAYDDFPNNKSYDVLNIGEYLIQGKNELFIVAYAQGIGSFQYIKGTPFLTFRLTCGDFNLVSDENVLCRENPFYKSGEVELISFQMAYSFEYDASKEETDFEYAALVNINEISKSFYERPIKKCVFEDKSSSIIKAQGSLIRKNGKHGSVSEHIKRDYLSTLMPSELLTVLGKNNSCLQTSENNAVLWNDEKMKGYSVSFCRQSDSDGVYLIIDLKKCRQAY